MKKTNVMVCITDQKKCDRLIYNAMEHIDHEESEIFVIHILKEGVIADRESAEALEYLIGLCNEYAATVSVIKSNDIRKTLIEFAKDKNVNKIIMGESRQADPKTSVTFDLKKELGEKVEVVIVPTK